MTEQSHEPGAEHSEETGHRHHDECYACPVGGFFLSARGASPEAFEHLLNAASELAAAARAMLEVAEGFIQQQRGPAEEPRVQRIDLDP